MEDMLIAKNQYIIDTDTANVAKRRLYSRDLPAVHDDYQLLERSTVNALVALLVSMTDVQQQHLDELVQGVHTKLEAAQSINIEQDQQTFLTMHSGMKLGGWEAPPDLHFEECPVWHDTVRTSYAIVRRGEPLTEGGMCPGGDVGHSSFNGVPPECQAQGIDEAR